MRCAFNVFPARPHRPRVFRLSRAGLAITLSTLLCGGSLTAQDGAPSTTPKPVATTRPELKQQLEALKGRTPRLPLPPLTEAEKAASKTKIVVSNGRARQLYLPKSWYAADFLPDPEARLDNTFKVRLFWIVSRCNNCLYCLGHQEHRLLHMGMNEDQIAALDSEWSLFPEPEQAAMRFTRKLTLTPHLIDDEDLASLKTHFSNDEVIELVYTVSFFNSVNRWTDSLGLPQDQFFRDDPIVLDSPTSSAFAQRTTAVVQSEDEARPALPPIAEVLEQIKTVSTRTPRVELPAVETVRQRVPAAWGKRPLPDWVRALSVLPTTGIAHARAMESLAFEGQISPRLKGQLAWTTARENRAIYSLAAVYDLRKTLGQTDAVIEALDRGEGLSPSELQAVAFARKLTVRPKAIADADIAALREHFADAHVAEIVYTVGAMNFFDRFTEALRLAKTDAGN